jgi:phosphotransferase system HPr (HPr) family protein
MISQKISSTHRESIGDIIPHIVQTSCAFNSVITFEVNDKRVNAKSIMGVMALASQDAPRIRVCADGEDEEEAVRAITGLLQ